MHETTNLSLTRKVSESFTLLTADGSVKITIARKKGQGCVLWINAPKSVRILREDAVQKKTPCVKYAPPNKLVDFVRNTLNKNPSNEDSGIQ